MVKRRKARRPPNFSNSDIDDALRSIASDQKMEEEENMTSQNRKTEVLSEGWKELELYPSLDKTLDIIKAPEKVTLKARELIEIYLQNAEEATDWLEKLTKTLLDTQFNDKFKDLVKTFSDSILDEVPNNNNRLEIYLSQLAHREFNDKHKLKWFFINRILENLDQPNLSLLTLSSFNNKEEFFSRDIDKSVIYTKLESGETLEVYWDKASYKYQDLCDGDKIYTLALDQDYAPEVIKQAASGGRLRMNEDSVVIGLAGETFPLSSYRNHKEIPRVTKELEQRVRQEKSLKVLVKGGSGTCKSQWARSFAKEVLDPLGYFTFFFSPESINCEIIPWFLPKVCCIVDEFVAENRKGGSDYVKSMTNKFLRMFDDTAFQDVKPYFNKEVDQEIIWIFTSNYEKIEDYDPAMIRRLDMIEDFTTDVNGNPIHYHLDN